MKYCWALILLFVQLSLSNDGSFIGNGYTVMPVKNNDVSMVSEVILIKEGTGLGWFVDVVANFKNLGPEQTVQFGFPFTVHSADPSDTTADPKFYTSINDVEIPCERNYSRNDEFGFNTVYLFPVHFKKGQTLSIHHSYTVGGEEHATGDASFSYILKTGAMWAKPIDGINISMEIPNKDLPQWHCFSPSAHIVSSDSLNTTLSWSFKNIRPDFNLQVERVSCISYCRDSINCEVIEGWLEAVFSLRDKNQSDYVKNFIYAFYGYPFKNPLLRAQFYLSGRFKESDSFDVSKMNPRHKHIIDRIEALIKK